VVSVGDVVHVKVLEVDLESHRISVSQKQCHHRSFGFREINIDEPDGLSGYTQSGSTFSMAAL